MKEISYEFKLKVSFLVLSGWTLLLLFGTIIWKPYYILTSLGFVLIVWFFTLMVTGGDIFFLKEETRAMVDRFLSEFTHNWFWLIVLIIVVFFGIWFLLSV